MAADFSDGVLYVVATPIGNLEDMTFRAVRVLSEVDIIAAEDTRKTKSLCKHFDIRTQDIRSMFTGNEASRSAELLAALQEGKSVAIASDAGTPGVSDPGHRLIRDAAGAGLKVVVVPGASAAICALVGSGLDSGEFRFVGFPPRNRGARQQLFGKLRSDSATLVLYESPQRVADTLVDLRDAFGGGRQATVARELTKLYEEYVRGTLAELSERYAKGPPRGECTIVIAGGDGEAQSVDIEAEVRKLLGEGLGAKDIAARLVVKTGKPRRELYQLVLSLQRSTES